MALGKRLIQTGAAACLTETTDIFGDSSGKALYSLDFDASDTSGSFNAIPTNVDFGVSGKTLNGARFNGSSSKIDLPSILPVNSTSSSSASCWFNTSYAGSNMGVILNAFTDDSAKPGWALFTEASANYLRLVNYHLGGSIIASDGATNVSDGNWHFVSVVFIYDGSSSSLKCYLDGNSTPEISITGFTPTRSDVFTERASIGYQNLVSGATRVFDGTIDQVRIFSKALSQIEMDTLYNSGNGETACVHTSTTDDINFPVTNAAYYKLDNSAEDEKGTYDGTETNVEYRFGRFGQAAVFNGSDSYINTNIPASVFNNYTWSISMWLKHSDTDFTYFAGTTTGNTVLNGMIFGIYGDGSRFDFIWRNASGTASRFQGGSLAINTWTNIVVTSNNNNIHFYQDGSLMTAYDSNNNQNPLSAASITHSQPFDIGRAGTKTTELLDGMIDQVRIFTSELSAADVLKLAEEKPETDTSNFKAVLYKGTAANQYISNVGMDLETSGGLVWIKDRTTAYSHALIDSVRGVSLELNSNDTSADYTETSGVTSLEKNGFFLGSLEFSYNKNNDNYVAWVWKGGGTPVPNTDGSIASSVSANTAAGFSIVSFTGNDTVGATVGHGLSSKPQLIFFKARTRVNNWGVYAEPITADKFLILNEQNAESDATGPFNDTEPTSSIITLGNSLSYNNAGTMIAYCFHSVAGYQKIGSYTGASSSTVPVTTNFRPSIVIIKNTDTASTRWVMYYRTGDSDSYYNYLFADDSLAEQGSTSSTIKLAISDTGFTVPVVSSTWVNNTGDNHIYIAIK